MDGSVERIAERIAELREQISRLPQGSLGTKRVNGKTYYYLRWQKNNKRTEKYVPATEVDGVREQIELRRALRKELERLEGMGGEFEGPATQPQATQPQFPRYRTEVMTGAALRGFASRVAGYRKRDCYAELEGFLYGEERDRILVLFGLRRTGKTTMIRQALYEMAEKDLERAAFIQVIAKTTLADVNADLKMLRDQGYRYVFIDEVTLMEDFIEGAALFSDVFAACGMKVVLSGTDSLGFLFAEDEQLYDRCVLLHTTFIPYREFDRVLGIRGIDEFIRYGGTMSMGGASYNERSTFATKVKADEYLDSSIAHNIQHSLKNYQDGGHFRALRDLYEHDELTGAINRVVEDMNHQFAVETFTRAFKSHDLAVSARNLRRDRIAPNDVLDRVDAAEVTRRLAALLEIREKASQTVEIRPAHVAEIKEYLGLLDLIADIDIIDLEDPGSHQSRTVFTQPGLRYAQVDALIDSLMLDATFANLSITERNHVSERIRSEVMGRMMEDIVLLETRMACPRKRVFKLQFAIGEYDMVVFDPATASCEVFEVKHSDQRDSRQYRHFVDEQKRAATEFRYGPIVGSYVLYRGEDAESDGVVWRNVERYLMSLGA